MKIPVSDYMQFAGFEAEHKQGGSLEFFFVRKLSSGHYRVRWQNNFVNMTEETFEAWKQAMFTEIKPIEPRAYLEPPSPVPADPHIRKNFRLLDIVGEIDL